MAALEFHTLTYQLTYENILWIYAEFHVVKYESQPGNFLQGPMVISICIYAHMSMHIWLYPYIQ